MLDEFLQQRKVPMSLRTRIREFFVFTGRRQLSPDDAALVEGAWAEEGQLLSCARAGCRVLAGWPDGLSIA